MKKQILLIFIFCSIFRVGLAQKAISLPEDKVFDFINHYENDSIDISFWDVSGVFIKGKKEPLATFWNHFSWDFGVDTVSIDSVHCTGLLMESIFGDKMKVKLRENDFLSGDFKQLSAYYTLKTDSIPFIDKMQVGDTLKIDYNNNGCYSFHDYFQICRATSDTYYLLPNGVYPLLIMLSQEAKDRFRKFELKGGSLEGGCTQSSTYHLELNHEVYSFWIMDGCSKDAFDIFIETAIRE